MISFKERFIQEETEQGITEKVNQFDNMAKETYQKAAPATNNIANAVTVAPQQSIIRTSEATDDLNRNVNPTTDDADKMARVTKRANVNAVTNNSQTSAGATITEATSDQDEVPIPGPYANGLTQRLNNIGINTGFSKPEFDPKGEASKTGQKNVNTGTESSFALGRSDAQRQAKDGLNTAQNTPGSFEVKQATSLTDSTEIKLNQFISLFEDDGGQVPGMAKPKVRTFQGVQPGTHTKETGAMVQSMNGVTDDKTRVQSKNRAATMPEYNDDPAGKKTGGIQMQRSSVVHGADALNAQTRAEKEQRMQGQQNG